MDKQNYEHQRPTHYRTEFNGRQQFDDRESRLPAYQPFDRRHLDHHHHEQQPDSPMNDTKSIASKLKNGLNVMMAKLKLKHSNEARQPQCPKALEAGEQARDPSQLSWFPILSPSSSPVRTDSGRWWFLSCFPCWASSSNGETGETTTTSMSSSSRHSMPESATQRQEMLLAILNVLFLAAGLSILGLGTYLHNSLTAVPFISNLLLVIGVCTTVIAGLGMLSIWRNSPILLCSYAVLLSIFLMLQIAVGTSTLLWKTNMKDTLLNEMRGALLSYGHPNHVFETLAWDRLQQAFDCCGLDSAADWGRVLDNQRLPGSCCRSSAPLMSSSSSLAVSTTTALTSSSSPIGNNSADDLSNQQQKISALYADDEDNFFDVTDNLDDEASYACRLPSFQSYEDDILDKVWNRSLTMSDREKAGNRPRRVMLPFPTPCVDPLTKQFYVALDLSRALGSVVAVLELFGIVGALLFVKQLRRAEMKLARQKEDKARRESTNSQFMTGL